MAVGGFLSGLAGNWLGGVDFGQRGVDLLFGFFISFFYGWMVWHSLRVDPEISRES